MTFKKKHLLTRMDNIKTKKQIKINVLLDPLSPIIDLSREIKCI